MRAYHRILPTTLFEVGDVVDTLDPDDLEVPLAVAITDTVGEVSLAKLTATALPVASLTGA